MGFLDVREFDRIFNEVLDTAYESRINLSNFHSSTNENEYVFEVYALGATKDDVKVDVQEDQLLVDIRPKMKSRYARIVKTKLALPKDVNLDSVDAKLENGILLVKISRMKPPKRSVSVSVN